jgi:hypothetical protein
LEFRNLADLRFRDLNSAFSERTLEEVVNEMEKFILSKI